MFNFHQDNNDNSDNETSEFTRENQEHLERLEQDYLKDLKTQEFIKSWIEMIMFNSCNVFITLWLINVGATLFLAVLAGFTIGSVPGMKAIADNFNLSKDSEAGMNFNINGKLINGLIKLLLAGSLTYFGATAEWRNVLRFADISSKAYIEQKEAYEKDKRQGLDPTLQFLIYTACGAAGAIFLLGLAKSAMKDFD